MGFDDMEDEWDDGFFEDGIDFLGSGDGSDLEAVGSIDLFDPSEEERYYLELKSSKSGGRSEGRYSLFGSLEDERFATAIGKAGIGILCEACDWVFTFNDWRRGDFHLLDTLGLLPGISHGMVRGGINVGKHGVQGLSRFGQIRRGIEKANDISKSRHNIKLSDEIRMDLKPGHPSRRGHFNKDTGKRHGFPHVHDPKAPGGVRGPAADDYIDIFKLYGGN